MPDNEPADDTTSIGTLTAPIAATVEYTSTLALDADRYASRELITIVPDSVVAFVRRDDQEVEYVDLEQYAPTPHRKQGAVAVTDHAALIEYVNRHKTTGTTLWGDDRTGRITAVIDDHQPGDGTDGAAWGQHRVQFVARKTPDWLHWAGEKDGKLLTQATFSEHIEDGLDAITAPDAADVLELAQSLQVRRGVNFKSARRLDNGETDFSYEETTTTQAGGKSGKIAIPAQFELALAPFDKTPLYKVVARFRYRLNEGALTMGFKLVRPDRVIKAAFDDLVTEVQEQTGLSVFAGTPRS